MALFKCEKCGATKEGRCKPKKCPQCGLLDCMFKEEDAASALAQPRQKCKGGGCKSRQ